MARSVSITPISPSSSLIRRANANTHRGVALLHPQAPNWFLSGKTPLPMGNAHPNISPYDKYATQTCEIFLAVGNDRQFQRLCGELGCAALAEVRNA